MPKTYTKNTWTDEELADEALYDILESDNTPINENVKIQLATDVITAGTSLTAEKINNIENGIDELDTKLADALDLLTTGGTSTAYTITTIGALALVTGEAYRIKFHTTAGATPTLNRDGLGAKLLKYYDATGAKQACTSTQIIANMILSIIYDGTDYVLLGGGSSGGISSIVSGTGISVDDTDPQNPVISATSTGGADENAVASLIMAFG